MLYPIKRVKIIYIYRNIEEAFRSMKRRNLLETNFNKLINNRDIKYTSKNMVKVMMIQFLNFYLSDYKNLLVLHNEELFIEETREKLETFLNVKLKNWPLNFKKRHDFKLSEDDLKIFKGYKKIRFDKSYYQIRSESKNDIYI